MSEPDDDSSFHLVSYEDEIFNMAGEREAQLDEEEANFSYDQFKKRLRASKGKATKLANRMKTSYNIPGVQAAHVQEALDKLTLTVADEYDELWAFVEALEENEQEQAEAEVIAYDAHYQQLIVEGRNKVTELEENSRPDPDQKDRQQKLDDTKFQFYFIHDKIDKGFKNLQQTIDTSQPLVSVNFAFDKLDAYYKDFVIVWSKYSSLLDTDKKAQEKVKFDEIDTAWDNLQLRYQQYLGTHTPRQAQQPQPPPQFQTPPPPPTQQQDKSVFQRVALPKFSGDRRAWATFFKTWTTVVEKQYPDKTTRALILKANLSGEALKAVERCEDDYDRMLKRLEQKYGDPVLLTQAIVNTINMTAIPEGNTKRFIEYVDQVSEAYERLKLRDKEHAINNVFIYGKLIEALPPSKFELWKQELMKLSAEDRDEPFDKYLDFLESHRIIEEQMETTIKNRQKSASKPSTANQGDEKPRCETCQKRHTGTCRMAPGTPGTSSSTSSSPASGSSSSGTSRSQTFKFNCYFCPEDKQRIVDCPRYKAWSAKERHENLTKKGLCIRCFGKHLPADCKSDRKCKNCSSGSHHTTLCNKAGTSTAGPTPTTTSTAQTSHVQAKHPVILQIMKVQLPYNNGVKYINTFFDSGSDSNYVLNETAAREGWDYVPTSLQIRTLQHRTSLKTKLYKVPIVDVQGNVHYVEAYGLDNISD